MKCKHSTIELMHSKLYHIFINITAFILIYLNVYLNSMEETAYVLIHLIHEVGLPKVQVHQGTHMHPRGRQNISILVEFMVCWRQRNIEESNISEPHFPL